MSLKIAGDIFLLLYYAAVGSPVCCWIAIYVDVSQCNHQSSPILYHNKCCHHAHHPIFEIIIVEHIFLYRLFSSPVSVSQLNCVV
jgi:hypothetical protein